MESRHDTVPGTEGDVAQEVRAVVWQSAGSRFDPTLGVSKYPRILYECRPFTDEKSNNLMLIFRALEFGSHIPNPGPAPPLGDFLHLQGEI